MAEYEDEDELPSVDHGPLNEGLWEKGEMMHQENVVNMKCVQSDDTFTTSFEIKHNHQEISCYKCIENNFVKWIQVKTEC